MVSNQYITRDQFKWVLDDLNAEYDERKQQELLDRATADLEGDLCVKFQVPLVGMINNLQVPYVSVPNYGRNKVLNAIKEKIREIIGNDKNRNAMAAIDSTEKFINVHRESYKNQIKELLNPMAVFGFLTLDQAAGNAQGPVQGIGLSRGRNRTTYDGTDQ